LMADLDVAKLLKRVQTLDVIFSVLFDPKEQVLLHMQKRQTIDSDSSDESQNELDEIMHATKPNTKTKERERFRKSIGNILKFYENKELSST